MKHLILLTCIFSYLANATHATAGGVDSGGGKSIVCRNADGKITSAELLDIYEGRILNQRTPLADHATYKEQLNKLVDKVETFGPQPFNTHNSFRGQVSGMVSQVVMLPNNVHLEPTSDALNAISAPQGCKIEQLAIYVTRLGKLLIDAEIWDSIDDTNRAALMLHETIYRILRSEGGETDSFYTRQVVSYYLSVPQAESIDAGVPAEAYECTAAPNAESLSPGASFYIYKNTEGRGPNYFVIQTNVANSIQMFTKTTNLILLSIDTILGNYNLGELVGADNFTNKPSVLSYFVGTKIGADGGAANPGLQAKLQFKPGVDRMNFSIGFTRPDRPLDDLTMYQLTCMPKQKRL